MRFTLLYALLLFLQPSMLPANFDDSPPCFKEFEVRFFNPNLVMQALSLHNVEQSRWDIITSALQSRSFEVPQIVKARARKMQPNPLEYPFQKQASGRLLLQVLFEVFSKVLYENHVTNTGAVREMFEYIRVGHGQALKECIEEKQR